MLHKDSDKCRLSGAGVPVMVRVLQALSAISIAMLCAYAVYGQNTSTFPSSGGGGTPGGSSGDVQYNNSGALGGNNGFIYDGANVLAGPTTANTTQQNIDYTTSTGLYSTSSTTPIVSPFDQRWTYTGAAPTGGVSQITGPSFYTSVNPSTSVDNHSGSYNGLSATVFSNNTGVLEQLIGGRFAAIRWGGSSNPIFGITGVAQAGDQVGGLFNGDGTIGGMFTSYVDNAAATNTFDPMIISGQSGVIGKCISINTYLATLDCVGTAGWSESTAGVSNAYGGWFGAGGAATNTGNRYGVYITDVTGATNLNMALKTGAGIVQFNDDLVLGKDVVGSLSVKPIGSSTISMVESGCSGQYIALGCSSGGSKTYTYIIVPILASGKHGPASSAVSVTTGFDDLSVSGQNNRITFSKAEGAVGGYDIYRTVAGGTTTNTTGKIANIPESVGWVLGTNSVPSPNGPSFADSGQAGDSTSPPTTGNTTGTSSFGGAMADIAYSYQTPSTGFSITLAGNIWHTILNPSGTLATGTITMPASPVDGQIVDVRTTQTITALTVAANSGQSILGNPSTLGVGGFVYCVYRSGNTTWFCGTPPSSGGGGTPCTSTANAFQYDNSGAFGCALVYDSTHQGIGDGTNWMLYWNSSFVGVSFTNPSTTAINLFAGNFVTPNGNVFGSNGMTLAGTDTIDVLTPGFFGALRGISAASTAGMAWSATNDPQGGVWDVGLDRDAAGVLGVTDGGAAANYRDIKTRALQAGLLYSAAGTALPTCNSGLNGTRAVVSDATTPTYHGAYSSGGGVVSPVFCNGTAWLTD
jgi:hypothetical protein